MAKQYKPDFTTIFGRQYGKLTDDDKALADTAIKNLTAYVNAEDRKSEEMERIGQDLRVKVITRFKKQRPRRMEATFAYDGRIVWALDGDLLRFIYIGPHSVLDKK